MKLKFTVITSHTLLVLVKKKYYIRHELNFYKKLNFFFLKFDAHINLTHVNTEPIIKYPLVVDFTIYQCGDTLYNHVVWCVYHYIYGVQLESIFPQKSNKFSNPVTFIGFLQRWSSRSQCKSCIDTIPVCV